MTKLLPWNWGIMPWNWAIVRRFKPKSVTGRVLWYSWWGLAALPGPHPFWALVIWYAYENGWEKELEFIWWVISTTASYAWSMLKTIF